MQVCKLLYNQAALLIIHILGGNGWGSNLDQLFSPCCVYFDSLLTQSLYVSDTSNHRIMKYPANSTGSTYGVVVAGNGTDGPAPNELNYPYGITFDANGFLYISDSGMMRENRSRQ